MNTDKHDEQAKTIVQIVKELHDSGELRRSKMSAQDKDFYITHFGVMERKIPDVPAYSEIEFW